MKKASGYYRHRISTAELLLVVVFTAIGVAALFFGCYTVQRQTFIRAEAGLFSKNAFVLAVRDVKTEVDVTDNLLTLLQQTGDVTVYQFRLPGCYGIAFSGIPAFNPNLTSGRYFESSDFDSDRPVCVIGKNLLNNLRRIDGERCYTAPDGRVYRAVGTIGYDVTSDVNGVTLLAFNGIRALISESYPFIIDFADAGQGQQIRQIFIDFLTAQGVSAVELDLPSAAFSVSGFFNMELLNLILFIFAGFCVVLSTVPLTLMWAQKRRKTVAIQRLLGFGTGYVVARMFGRLLVLFHAGFALSFVVYSALARWTDLQFSGFFSAEMGIAYLGALFFNLLIALVPMVQTMRVDPGDALRRE